MNNIYTQRGRGLNEKLLNLSTDQKVFYVLYDLLGNYLQNSHSFSFTVFDIKRESGLDALFSWVHVLVLISHSFWI